MKYDVILGCVGWEVIKPKTIKKSRESKNNKFKTKLNERTKNSN